MPIRDWRAELVRMRVRGNTSRVAVAFPHPPTTPIAHLKTGPARAFFRILVEGEVEQSRRISPPPRLPSGPSALRLCDLAAPRPRCCGRPAPAAWPFSLTCAETCFRNPCFLPLAASPRTAYTRRSAASDKCHRQRRSGSREGSRPRPRASGVATAEQANAVKEIRVPPRFSRQGSNT